MTMDTAIRQRVRNDQAESLIVSAEKAAELVKDGMIIGVSGFTPSGYPKAVPVALAERAKSLAWSGVLCAEYT